MHACTSVVRILACGYRIGLQLLVRQLEVLVCISRQLANLTRSDDSSIALEPGLCHACTYECRVRLRVLCVGMCACVRFLPPLQTHMRARCMLHAHTIHIESVSG